MYMYVVSVIIMMVVYYKIGIFMVVNNIVRVILFSFDIANKNAFFDSVAIY